MIVKRVDWFIFPSGKIQFDDIQAIWLMYGNSL